MHCLHWPAWASGDRPLVPVVWQRFHRVWSQQQQRWCMSATPFCAAVACACVSFGSESAAWDRAPPPPIHPPAVEKLFVCFCAVFFCYADATGDYFGLLSPVFSKGRSRVWLTSRPSWTGWPANRTPWFQLTTYRRRQGTKREGNIERNKTMRKKTTKKTTKNKNTAASSAAFILWSNTCTFKRKTLTKLC